MGDTTLLQIALDCTTIQEALEISRQVENYVDILEVGTPLLKSEGRSAIVHLRNQFPNKPIFADTKTMDMGDLEARIVFEAGADIMSVCGVASIETIEAAIDQARLLNKQILIDLIGVHDKLQCVERLRWTKPNFIGIQTGIDEQRKGKFPYQDLEIISQAVSFPLVVAGGISLDDIPYLMMFRPAIIVVGGFITRAKDLKAAAETIKEAICKG
ncbi:MAG TPA: 3-hexulose-6-phosphate synthase [Candidatus Limnocylindrales bacterium]|nr:3-hexulose-6-phosphate synthase [Candidatus Limnocylindrales bacterium]